MATHGGSRPGSGAPGGKQAARSASAGHMAEARRQMAEWAAETDAEAKEAKVAGNRPKLLQVLDAMLAAALGSGGKGGKGGSQRDRVELVRQFAGSPAVAGAMAEASGEGSGAATRARVKAAMPAGWSLVQGKGAEPAPGEYGDAGPDADAEAGGG